MASDSRTSTKVPWACKIAWLLLLTSCAWAQAVRGIQILDGNGSVRGVAVDANKNMGVVLAAETTKVLGTIRITGNVGGVVDAATGAAPPANGIQITGVGSGATAGFALPITVCTEYANIDQTSGEQIITGVASRRIYICSLNLVTASAQNIAVVAGTGTVCATTTVAVPGTSGGATAATGLNLAANSGIVVGSGLGAIAKTTVDADNLCILQSGSGQISGGISYAIY